MGKADAVDRFQRRHRWAGLPLAVVYKYNDDQGNYLAALIAFYGFLSVFPLLLLLVTVLGYALHGNADLQQEVLSSAVAQFPVIGDQLASNIHSLHGNPLALTVGLLGSVYGGLGVAQAAQNAMNKIWGVPRHARPNAIKSRGISLLLLLVIGGGLLLTTVLSALSTAAHAYGADLGAGSRALTSVAAVVVNALLFIFAFRVLTAREISTRQVRGGAIAAAITWQLLQVIGTYAVGHALKGASATYGVFGLVLGLITYRATQGIPECRHGLRPTRHSRAAQADRRALTPRHRQPAPPGPGVTHTHRRGGRCRDCSMWCIPAIHRIGSATGSPVRSRSCLQSFRC